MKGIEPPGEALHLAGHCSVSLGSVMGINYFLPKGLCAFLEHEVLIFASEGSKQMIQ
jgi:hypothetical protein